MGFESDFDLFAHAFSMASADVEGLGIGLALFDAPNGSRCGMLRRSGRTAGQRRSTRGGYELMLVEDWPGSEWLYDESRGVARVHGADAGVAVRCSINSMGMEHVGQSHQEVGGLTARSASARLCVAC
jgi:hypothetical protein